MHEAMRELGAHASDGRLRRMSREIAQGAAQGQSFAEQFARYSQLVPSYVRGMLLAGEKAGALPRVCQELAEELRQQQKARWAAAIAQLWLSIIFLLGLFVAGLPRLINPEHVDFAAYRQYLAHVAFPVLICVFVFWLGARLIGALPWLAVPLQAILYYLPATGGLIRRAALPRFFISVQALLRAGIQIPEAFALAAPTCGNIIMEKQLLKAGEMLRQGRPLAQALQSVGFLPHTAKESLVLSERAGSYEHVLHTLAEEAKASKTRFLWLMQISGYGVLLLLSAIFVATIIYVAMRDYANALLRLELE